MKLLMSMPRTARLAAALALCCASLCAQAQGAYPNRPIKFVVGFSAGGSTDVIARILARRMSEVLGQAIVIENKPGADSLVATQFVAQAAPDGYTMLVSSGSHSINASLYPNNRLDPVKDFAPISLIGDAANFLVVHPSVPAQTVEELIALARKNPGKLNYASSASTTFLQTELFKSMAGINMQSIPYKGAGPAVPALLSGEVQVSISSIVTLIQHVKAGTARALAVTSARRSSLVPEVPTTGQLGFADVRVRAWNAIFARAGTPAPAIDLLTAEITRILGRPEVGGELKKRGLEVTPLAPAAFKQRMAAESAQWKAVVTAGNITLD
jgi:tripartite-type tricarboxylate transporter receptor subunit TctC